MAQGSTADEQEAARLAALDAERTVVPDDQAEDIVRLVLAWAQPARTDRALDLGCGLGRLTVALAERFGEAIGCDANATAVAQAAARQADGHLTWAPIADGRVPAADGSCDFVLCYEVLPYLADADAVEAYVREAARVLRPGGRAVLHVDTQRARDAEPPAPARSAGRFRRRYPLAPDEPAAIVARAGLRTVAELQAGTRVHLLLVTPA